MESAFGVDHGEISKSWKKLGPKLARANSVARPTDSMAERMKVNYAQGRGKAGFLGGRHGVGGDLRRAERAGDSKNFMGEKYKDINLEEAAKTKVKARKNKDFASASATGYSNNVKRNRTLP